MFHTQKEENVQISNDRIAHPFMLIFGIYFYTISIKNDRQLLTFNLSLYVLKIQKGIFNHWCESVLFYKTASWIATNSVRSVFLAAEFLFQSAEKLHGRQQESWESKKKLMRLIEIQFYTLGSGRDAAD